MAQKQSEQLATEQKLEKIKQRRRQLGNVYDGLDQATEQLFEQKTSKTALDQQKSKLDAGLEEFNTYKGSIADLAAGLTSDLDQYVQLASSSQNYQGFLERTFAWLPLKAAKRRADGWRIERLKHQSPKDNLKTIVNYAMQLHDEILEVREEAAHQFEALQANTDLIVTKVAEYQPQEEQLKAKLDAMETAYKAKQEAYRTASPAEQAKMLEEMNAEQKKLTEIREKYDTVLTIYNQAQQALEANIRSRNAYEQMVRDLGRQATLVEEKMDNVTAIYEAAPEAVKIMMTTKGMESLDKTLNVATDKSVDIILQAGAAVNDATLRREEIQLIDPARIRDYIARAEAANKDFVQRFEKIRQDALRSQAARYAVPNN